MLTAEGVDRWIEWAKANGYEPKICPSGEYAYDFNEIMADAEAKGLIDAR